jgi:hypothetical protein
VARSGEEWRGIGGGVGGVMWKDRPHPDILPLLDFIFGCIPASSDLAIISVTRRSRCSRRGMPHRLCHRIRRIRPRRGESRRPRPEPQLCAAERCEALTSLGQPTSSKRKGEDGAGVSRGVHHGAVSVDGATGRRTLGPYECALGDPGQCSRLEPLLVTARR